MITKMGILATSEKELIYIYSDQSDMGKKILPYAMSSKKAVRTININKEKISDTIWTEIADKVNKPLKDLFSFELSDQPELDKDTNYSTEDILKIIQKNPSLLQHPIAINGNKASSLKDRFDFYEFFEADGSNFDKSDEAIKNAEHEDTSNDSMNNIINKR